MTSIPPDARAKYFVHKADAKRRGIEFLFSFEEWWDFWLTDDRWSRRGRGKGKLVMARFGDQGPYAPDNVRCATYEENNAEVTPDRKSDASRRSHITRNARGSHNPLRLRGKGHPKARAVETPLGMFESGYLAAEAEGVSRNAIYWKIKHGTPGYRWLER